MSQDPRTVECDGLCVTAADVGVPGHGVAYAHPGCPAHSPGEKCSCVHPNCNSYTHERDEIGNRTDLAVESPEVPA
jgi:hypothetical protein